MNNPERREIWYTIIRSVSIKKHKTVPDVVTEYEVKTTVIGSTFDEVMSLPTNPRGRIEGEIKEIEFLKYLSLTMYEI